MKFYTEKFGTLVTLKQYANVQFNHFAQPYTFNNLEYRMNIKRNWGDLK